MTLVTALAATVIVLFASVLLYPLVAKVRRRSGRPHGIQVISDPEDPAFDIVAVHGLGADPERTWTHKVPGKSGKASDVQRISLLKDLLKADFPEARILSFAYNSDWFIDAPVKTGQQIANTLVRQLADHRSDRHRVPIIFIGHSFGGIIIKEALCRIGESPQDIVDDTCGIIFLGTPHLGSAVSFFGALLSFLTGFLGSNTTLLLSLRNRENGLSDLEDRFVECMKLKETQRKKTEIISFYETKPTYLLGWLYVGLIVDRDSARGGHAPEAIDINTDHSGLNKCRKEDPLYKELTKGLKRLRTRSTTTKPTLTRSQQYVVEKLKPTESAAFDSYDNSREPLCHHGTRQKLLREIDEWAKDPTSKHMFWLEGGAGTGKSTLSRTVAQNASYARCLGASFFFKRGEGDRGKALRFFASIAAQLVCRLPLMADHVRYAIEADKSIIEKALLDQFNELILHPLKNINGSMKNPPKTFIVVIDALDECDDEQDIKDIIRLLSQAICLPTTRLKFFITGRPELPLLHGFADIQDIYTGQALHKVPECVIEEDIHSFLRFRLEQIRDQFNKTVLGDRKLKSTWPDPDKLKELVQMAIPLFIFAATACRFIEDRRSSGGGPNDRLEKILKYQHSRFDLSTTYLPVLDQMIVGLDDSEKVDVINEFKNVVGSIVTLASPLSAISLGHLLDVDPEVVHGRLDLLHSVLNIPPDAASPVRLFHLSFHDFLIKHHTDFQINERDTHEKLANKCLELLSKNGKLHLDICELKTPGKLRKEVEQDIINAHIPQEIQYACRFWVHHWTKSEMKVIDGDNAHEFLKGHFLHWLEALSLLGRISESISLIDELQNMVDSVNGPNVSEFLRDAKRFTLYFRTVIDIAPLQAYASALVFAPERSVVRQAFEELRHRWIPRAPIVGLDWDPYLYTLEGHRSSVLSVAFSSDGKQIASGAGDNTIRIWDTVSGKVQTLQGHDSPVYSVAFSSDGKQLASGSGDNTINIWDIALGKAKTFKGHNSSVLSVVFSPNNKELVSGSADTTIKKWDIASGNVQTLEGDHGPVYSVALSHNGKQLASGSSDNTINIWDTASGKVQTLKGHSGSIWSVAFSSDGKLASGSADNTVKIWDVATSKAQTLKGHHGSVWSVAFSSDNKLLASCSDEKIIKIWDTTSGQEIQTLKGHHSSVRSISFSNNKQLVSGSGDNTIKIWDTTLDTEVEIFNGHRKSVWSVAFSPDGKQLASGSSDNTIKIWDTASGKEVKTLKGHKDWVYSVAFSHDGKRLASGSDDYTIRIWDIVSGKTVRTLTGHRRSVWSVAFSPDSKQLASGSDDCTVKIWDIASGEAQTLEGYRSSVCSVAFSPSGKQLAIGLSGYTIKIWDVALSKEIQTLKGHYGWVNSLAFSRDDKQLISGSDDNTIKIWDTASGKDVQTLVAHYGSVYTIAFSCTGTQLASESYGYSLSLDKTWITRNGQNFLWLPPEYRPVVCFTVWGQTVSIGCRSGRVLIFGF